MPSENPRKPTSSISLSSRLRLLREGGDGPFRVLEAILAIEPEMGIVRADRADRVGESDLR